MLEVVMKNFSINYQEKIEKGSEGPYLREYSHEKLEDNETWEVRLLQFSFVYIPKFVKSISETTWANAVEGANQMLSDFQSNAMPVFREIVTDCVKHCNSDIISIETKTSFEDDADTQEEGEDVMGSTLEKMAESMASEIYSKICESEPYRKLKTALESAKDTAVAKTHEDFCQTVVKPLQIGETEKAELQSFLRDKIGFLRDLLKDDYRLTHDDQLYSFTSKDPLPRPIPAANILAELAGRLANKASPIKRRDQSKRKEKKELERKERTTIFDIGSVKFHISN
jgi:hypothetical protein